jgi:hypothetical protein
VELHNDFDAVTRWEFMDGDRHKLAQSVGDSSSANAATINSSTDAYYDYAIEWDGTDLHVIACNINSLNTEPAVSQGGSFSRVYTYSGYTARSGDLPLVFATKTGGAINLTTASIQNIRIPLGVHDIMVGEDSSGSGDFAVSPVASKFDAHASGHAPASFTYDGGGITLNAGTTYRFIYHPSMEAGDYIEFRLASDQTTVYSTGVTTFDGTSDGDPKVGEGYKGVTFAVPTDAPPLRLFFYNSHNTGSFDSGRDITISGSTYTVDVTGITPEGPAANQTGNSGANLFDAPTGSNGWGWLSIDEQLGGGERLVLNNTFMVDLTDAMPDDSIVFLGLKDGTFSNSNRSNSGGSNFEGGAYFAIYRYSVSDIRIFGYVSGGSTIGRNFGTNWIANHGVELAFDLTSSGNNIRLMMRTSQTNSSDNASTTAYVDWDSSYKTQTGDQGFGLTSVDVVMLGDGLANGATADFNTADVDWTNLSEVSIPAPAATLTTNWTKALDFSGSSERTLMVNNNYLYTPLKMANLGVTVGTPSVTGYTSNDSNARPWATAVVFSSDNNSSNQHIWNLGEGAGTTDDNIYLRLDASGNLYFGWGRSGELNECTIGSNVQAGTWYGLYIAHNGTRYGTGHLASQIAACFDIRFVDLSTGVVGSNLSTSARWSSYGARMNRTVEGSMSIGGRDANRNFHGKVAAMVVTTLRLNVAMPGDSEISMMVRDPMEWLADYKVGNNYRRPSVGTDNTNFQFNSYDASYATQVWLMGDGTSDAYAKIRNQVYPAEQNRTPMNMVSMVSNDIQTVTIPGLS